MNTKLLVIFYILALHFSSILIADETKTIRAGVASMITPVSAVKYYHQVVDYLGNKLNMPAEMVHRTTYDEIDVMLEDEQVDVAFICSSPYVMDKEKFGVELLVAPIVDNKPFYQSYIIVHKESSINSVEGLRGKTFVFVDPKSNTGLLYPTYMLAKKHTTPDHFFDSSLYSYSHNKSVEMVAKKRAAAAAVDSIVYNFMLANNSPYAKQTRIIHRSQQFGIPPVVVPPGISPFLKRAMRDIFLDMHNDRKGKQILNGMGIDRFAEVPDSNYDGIRAMRAFIKNNKKLLRNRKTQVSHNLKKESSTIYFGILPRDNPVISYELYQPLFDYLSKKTGRTIELRLEKSYKAVVNSLGRGEIAFALLGPLTYLDAYKRYDAPPIAKSRTSKGESFYRSVIVSKTNGTIKDLNQLANKKFAFAAVWSTSGNLIPRYMLARSKIHLNNLDEFHHFNYHDTVAKKVISGEFDAGAIRLSKAEQYLPYGLNIIATSDPIPTGPVVVSPKASYVVVQRVQKALLEMAEDEMGREILKRLDPDLQGGFVAASDVDYSKIRKMINDVPLTCGKGCHPKGSF